MHLFWTQSTNTTMSFGWKVQTSSSSSGLMQLTLIYAALRGHLRQRCIKSLGVFFRSELGCSMINTVILVLLCFTTDFAVGISSTYRAMTWILTKGTWFLADVFSTLAAAFLLLRVPSCSFCFLKLNLQLVCVPHLYTLRLMYIAGHLLWPNIYFSFVLTVWSFK